MRLRKKRSLGRSAGLPSAVPSALDPIILEDPGVETPGYFHGVPPGLEPNAAQSFSKAQPQ